MSHRRQLSIHEITPGWHWCRSKQEKETHNLEARGGFCICTYCGGILFDENYDAYMSRLKNVQFDTRYVFGV